MHLCRAHTFPHYFALYFCLFTSSFSLTFIRLISAITHLFITLSYIHIFQSHCSFHSPSHFILFSFFLPHSFAVIYFQIFLSRSPSFLHLIIMLYRFMCSTSIFFIFSFIFLSYILTKLSFFFLPTFLSFFLTFFLSVFLYI